MPDTNEKTLAQRAPWWNPFGWGGYSHGHDPITKSQHGSGAATGDNDYDKPCHYGTVSTISGVDFNGAKPFPGTLATYRAMNAHPTLALAQAAIVLSVLAAEWLVTIDDELADDETALFGKAIIEAELIKRRTQFLRDVLRTLCYGYQAFEVVCIGKTDKTGRDYTGYAKLKPLMPDDVTAVTDLHGNLVQVKQGGVELNDGEYLWLVYDKEGDNWYGRSRHENVRRTWSNALTLEDKKMRLADLGTGIIPYIGVPTDSKADVTANTPHNKIMGQGMAAGLKRGQAIVYTNLIGIDPRDIVNNEKLSGASNVSVNTIDMGTPGPTIAAIGAEQDRLDKYMVRGWLQPERTLTEATMGGSRADSESHGDMALADAEAVHELLVEQINEQLVARLILENCGAEYVDRVRLTAAPIQDEQKRQLSALVAALLTDPQFKASLVDSIGDEGLQGIFDRLGMGVKLANPFEPLIGDEPDPATGKPASDGDTGDDEGDDDGVSLSAADGGQWFTTETGTHVHIGKGGTIDKGPKALTGKKLSQLVSKGKAASHETVHAEARKPETKAKPAPAKSDHAAAVLDQLTTPANGSRDGDYVKVKEGGDKFARGETSEHHKGFTDLHKETQDRLKKQGVASITGYRGLEIPADHPLAQALASGKLKSGDRISIDHDGIQSFSESPHVAHNFAHSMTAEAERTVGSRKTIGIVIQREIPAEHVVAAERTHAGFIGGEDEVVAKSPGKYTARIVSHSTAKR